MTRFLPKPLIRHPSGSQRPQPQTPARNWRRKISGGAWMATPQRRSGAEAVFVGGGGFILFLPSYKRICCWPGSVSEHVRHPAQPPNTKADQKLQPEPICPSSCAFQPFRGSLYPGAIFTRCCRTTAQVPGKTPAQAPGLDSCQQNIYPKLKGYSRFDRATRLIIIFITVFL